MSTTDRLDTDELNTQRTTTDRLGNTMTLGTAIKSGAVSVTATIVEAAVGASIAHGPLAANAISTLDMFNGSIGPIATEFYSTASVELTWGG